MLASRVGAAADMLLFAAADMLLFTAAAAANYGEGERLG